MSIVKQNLRTYSILMEVENDEKNEKIENLQKSSEMIVLDHKHIIIMKIDKKSDFNVVYVQNT